MALPKRHRLKRAKDISTLFSSTRPSNVLGFSLRIQPTTADYRVAVVVPSSGITKAHMRNEMKRKVLECMRRLIAQHKIHTGYSLLVTVRSTPNSQDELEATLMLLLKKSGILQS